MTDDEHLDDDLLLATALGGGAPDAESARAAGHLASCTDCRAAHTALLEAVDLTLAATPHATPPPGFESRVLEALQSGTSQVQGPGGRRVRDRLASGWLLAAAGFLVGIALGAGGLQLLSDRDEPPVAAVALTTDSGRPVGTVSGTDGLDGPQLVIVLRGDPPGTTVVCRAVLADGSVRELARWPVGPYTDSTWVIDRPAGARAVELTDEAGTVWAAADL